MIRFLIISLLILLTPTLMMAQNNDQLWKNVEKLINDGKPASATEIVDGIYKDARAQNDYDEIIKSLFFLNSFKRELEEDFEAKTIARYTDYYENETDKVIKALLANSLAKYYINYLQNFGWRQQNRTEQLNENDGDILTYSNAKLIDKSNEYFIASIAEKDLLKSIPVSDIPNILNISKYIHMDADLYLILAMDLVSNFQNTNHYVTTPLNDFQLDQEKLFANIENYLTIDFGSNDKFYKRKYIAELFQELLIDYGSTSEFNLIKINLERLRYMGNHATDTEKSEKRMKALEVFHNKYKSSEHAELIEYELMNYYMTNLPFNIYQNVKNKNQLENLKKVLPIIQKLAKSKNNVFKSAADNAEALINNKELQIQNENVISSQKEALVLAKYRNVSELSFKIVEVDNDAYQKIQGGGDENKFSKFQKYKSIAEWKENLPQGDDHIIHSMELVIPQLPVGQYVILAYDGSTLATSKLVHGSRLHVSNLTYVYSSTNGNHQVIVMDRESGEPISDAKVEVFTDEYNRSQRKNFEKKLFDGKTNKDGIYIITQNYDRGNLKFKISKAEDFLYQENQYAYLSRKNQGYTRSEILWFTDRAIYRPGQIIHYKGILLNFDEDNYPTIKKDQRGEVILRDANYQDVETQNIRTDEFGSFYGSFVIPSTGLNGNFTLSANNSSGQKNLKVEEYKRPKFKPSFEDSFKEFQLGDTVSINAIAKTYAGISMDGAQYRYTVHRQSYWPWYRMYFYCGYNPLPQSGKTLVKRGNGIVDKNGKVPIEFYAEDDSNQSEFYIKPSYYFSIELELIDINGETQSATKQLSLSEEGYQIIARHESHLPKGEKPIIDLSIKNFDNQTIPKDGELLFSRIELKHKHFKNKYWEFPEFQKLDSLAYKRMFPNDLYSINEHPYQQKNGKLEKTVKFNTKDGTQIGIEGLTVGLYLLEVKVDGEKTDYQSYIQIFDKELEGITELKVVGATNEYEKGQTAEFTLVNNFKNSNVLYSLYKKGDLEKREWVRSGTQQRVNIDSDAYGNLVLHGMSVRHNRIYEVRHTIKVPWKHKNLEIEYTTFRDKILPGAEEEFTVKVKSDKNTPAQLTLGLYDASLDAFVKNYWAGIQYPTYNYVSESKASSFGNNSSRLFSKYRNAYYRGSQLNLFPSFKFAASYGYTNFNAMTSRSAGISVRGSRSKESDYYIDGVRVSAKASAPSGVMDEVSYDAVPEAMSGDKDLANESNENNSNELADKAPPLRKNLEETVFFYPSMTTDEIGELSYSFIMKEAITEWNLMTFAHNKEGQYALDERTLVTKKNLLIQANMPRFLRAGDVIDFTAKVSNLSDGSLEGAARVEILNAITEESITEMFVSNIVKQDFQLEQNESKIVSWQINVPNDFIMPVIIRVYANSGEHTDGEQNMLTVLTNRKFITATKSMMVRPMSEKTFEFEHLLENIDGESLESFSYQVEFTTNPVWFAIKAMPYLKNVDPDYTMRLTDQLFANTLASSIVKKYPAIKSVFEQWKSDPEGLKSELEKSEELKNVLLNETPWVRQSQSEAEQRRDIALLFDISMLSNQLETSLTALERRQDSNGGFSWKVGGRDSWYVTQYVVEQLLKLKHLDLVNDERLDRIIDRGINYNDIRVNEYYKKYEKLDKKNSYLSPIIIQYIYINSMHNGALFGDILPKYKNYIKKACEENWTSYSPYMQSMIAIAHNRSGEKNLSELIRESLLERVIKNEEQGAYWKANNAYSWYNLAIEQQAMMIEYFEELGGYANLVDEMKMYLLSKKQTTHWPTTKSTSAAIFALLNNSGDWITESRQIEVWVGKDKLKIDKQESGTGQFNLKFDGNKVDRGFGKIKVNNPNDYLVWGAAYWQYWQDLDQIDAANENPFNIEKEVFLETETDEGEKLVKIDSGTILKRGDKLTVRIELRTDRDLDYVHMQDMRAAGLEPINVLSQYKYQDGLSYYETTKDRYTDFFFERMNRGTYVFEYNVRVTHKGIFSNGITTAQCLYAPSFAGHSVGRELSFQ